MDKQEVNTIDAALQNAFEGETRDLPDDYIPQTRDEEPEEEKEELKVEAEIEEEAEEEIEDDLAAPIHWSSEDRELFNSQPRETKEFLLKQHKSMEADYTRKSQENAEYIKHGQALKEALAPVADHFRLQGLDEVQAVRQLSEVAKQLISNPAETIQYLAQQYNVSFDQNLSEEYEYIDPELKAIKEQQQRIEQELKQSQEQAKQSELNAYLKQISEFSQATDASGNLAHPFFEDVRTDMSQIFQARAADSLEQAYNMAIAKYPELIQKQSQLQKEIDEKKIRQEKKEKAKKAKKAAIGVSSSTSANVTKSSTSSLDDLITQAINDATN